MASALVRGLVGVLGVATATLTIACEGDLEDTEAVDEAEAAITMDEPVLVSGACVTVSRQPMLRASNRPKSSSG